jgi:hypothetical protein
MVRSRNGMAAAPIPALTPLLKIPLPQMFAPAPMSLPKSLDDNAQMRSEPRRA